MADPMPPLPPVTNARVGALFIFQLFVGVEYYRGAATQQISLLGPQREIVERRERVAGHARYPAHQITVDVVEAQNLDSNVPQAGKKSHLGARRSRTIRQVPDGSCAGSQCAMHRHGLCCVFYTAGGAEAPMRSHRMIGLAVSTTAAAYMQRVPLEYFVEQTHAATMRDVSLDPGAV